MNEDGFATRPLGPRSNLTSFNLIAGPIYQAPNGTRPRHGQRKARVRSQNLAPFQIDFLKRCSQLPINHAVGTQAKMNPGAVVVSII